MGSMFNEEELDETLDYIIFDNCDPEELETDYMIWIGGKDVYYGNEGRRGRDGMKWGKPCIWLSNDDPRECNKWDRVWVDENTVVIKLTHKLWE
jgi:hypothetical protein